MNADIHDERIPKFYGATTVGERGQVVIPAEARRDFKIVPATKLLVFGGPQGNFLFLAKAESITKLVDSAMNMFTQIGKSING
ncbi:MAG: AbrB/MazE/SpoVT family DNA-binding domain-containing protein [Chloroflexota bacterium]